MDNSVHNCHDDNIFDSIFYLEFHMHHNQIIFTPFNFELNFLFHPLNKNIFPPIDEERNVYEYGAKISRR
jgi:hypothetical protein